MAKAGARVHIYGDWDGTGVKKAKQDLSGFQKQAQGFTGAVGKSFLGMGAAIGGALALGNLASFAKDFSVQAIQMAQESQRTTDRIEAIAKSMGVFDTVLNGTTKRLTDYAQELQDATGISDETTKSGQAILLTFAEIAKTAGEAGGMFDRATAALLDLSAAGFGDATTNAKSLGKALNDPLKGLTALGRQGITFTQQEKDKVKALVDTNQTLAAQELIMAAVEKQVGGTAAAVANDFDKIKAAADDAQEIIGFALVDAVENLSDAMGGSAGLSDVVRGLGEGVADFVAGLGLATIEIVNFLNAAAGVEDVNNDANQSFIDFGTKMLDVVFHTNLAMGALWDWTEAGAAYRDEQAAIDATNLLATQRYTQMAVALGVVEVSTEAMAAEAEAAEEAVKAFKDEVKALRDSLSDVKAEEEYRRSIRDLGDDLKGASRNILGLGPAADTARDAIIDRFDTAAQVIEGWVEQGKIQASEFSMAFAGEAKTIVDEFVANGFKRRDIIRFLKEKELWTPEMQAMFLRVGDFARAAGVTIGKDLLSGMKGSLTDPNNLAALRYAGMQAAQAAEQGVREESETQSPSKKWAKLGGDLVSGLIIGLGSKKDALKAQATEVAQDLLDAASSVVDGWDVELDRLAGIYDEALGEFNSFKDGITADIFGRLDLDSAITEAENTGTGIVEALTSQASGIGTFAQNMIELTKTNLSQAAWQAVASLSEQRGTELSQQMLGAQGQTIIDGINKIYADVDTMATAVGLMAAQKWYGEGVAQAQANYEGFKANYGEGGPARKALENLMDRLAKSLNRTSTITIKTVYEAAGIDGKRAAGGPVSANKAYLVGERGPEVLVMGGQSGTIIPNSDLPTASGTFTRGGDGAALGGNSYTINVQAGMGADGAELGRRIVDAIKRYERLSGPVFASA